MTGNEVFGKLRAAGWSFHSALKCAKDFSLIPDWGYGCIRLVTIDNLRAGYSQIL